MYTFFVYLYYFWFTVWYLTFTIWLMIAQTSFVQRLVLSESANFCLSSGSLFVNVTKGLEESGTTAFQVLLSSKTGFVRRLQGKPRRHDLFKILSSQTLWNIYLSSPFVNTPPFICHQTVPGSFYQDQWLRFHITVAHFATRRPEVLFLFPSDIKHVFFHTPEEGLLTTVLWSTMSVNWQ